MDKVPAMNGGSGFPYKLRGLPSIELELLRMLDEIFPGTITPTSPRTVEELAEIRGQRKVIEALKTHYAVTNGVEFQDVLLTVKPKDHSAGARTGPSSRSQSAQGPGGSSKGQQGPP